MHAEAGEFAAWLQAMGAALRGAGGIEVPCGSCRGCCRSSYFIHVRPDEADTLRAVPRGLLGVAPGWPVGHRVIAIAADGRCPLFRDNACSIYGQRPSTCRVYDCRVFAAAGLQAGGAEKREINERVSAWRFSYANEASRRAHRAVRAAADFLLAHRDHFPEGRGPQRAEDVAVVAIKAHAVFLDCDEKQRSLGQTAEAIVAATRRFDAS